MRHPLNPKLVKNNPQHTSHHFSPLTLSLSRLLPRSLRPDAPDSALVLAHDESVRRVPVVVHLFVRLDPIQPLHPTVRESAQVAHRALHHGRRPRFRARASSRPRGESTAVLLRIALLVVASEDDALEGSGKRAYEVHAPTPRGRGGARSAGASACDDGFVMGVGFDFMHFSGTPGRDGTDTARRLAEARGREDAGVMVSKDYARRARSHEG